MKSKIKILFIVFILLLSSIIICGAIYYSKSYAHQEFDQIIFYLRNGFNHTSSEVVKSVIKANIVPVVLLFLILCLVIINIKNRIFLRLKIRNKNIKVQVYPISIIVKYRGIYATIIFTISIIIAILGFKINDFITYNLQKTEIYEKYYIDGKKVNIVFPEKKQNLIIISVESLENTTCSKENGGAWEYSIIPELERLAMENTNFSNNSNIGGGKTVYGTTFTAGGLVAQTAGIPLVTPAINYNIYNGSGKYLENVYTLGDMLEKQGYNLEIMMGSDGEFGGRTQYFTANGNYKIYDLAYAIEMGKMTEDDVVWWGFEDDKLFEWAKEETNHLANQDKPFNLIIHTADTHFVDGYLSKYAEDMFDTQYENVHAYCSKLVSEYVDWVQKQDFYKNTTIVIIGDHLGMQSEFYEEHTPKDYERTVYNAIINPVIEVKNSKNRNFTTMDMYPTILASIGVEIEGERLGLGTNLFSNRQTLAEELGYVYLEEEMKKTSEFYNHVIFGEDYQLIKEREWNRAE